MATYSGPIIDVDVHHRAKTEDEVIAYLPKQWREYMKPVASVRLPIKPPPSTSAGAMIPTGARRADTFPVDGSPPASDYDLMRGQLFDERPNYFRVLLTHDIGEHAGLANPYLAAAVCSALNDWNLEQWLARDSRLYSVIVVPMASPDQAAAEIRRVGAHPQIVGVLVAANPLGRAPGDPLLHPIYEAAAEMGLHIVFHPGISRPNNEILSVGGPKATIIEHSSQFSQAAMHYVSSFIVHGVFEKYPSLRITLTEYGITWIPYLVWRLDAEYETLRRESPWVQRWPREYIHDHVRFSTQPLDAGSSRKGFTDLLTSLDGMEDLLLFSSDYPHSSMDDPDYVASWIPSGWHRKVFYENACALYGWHSPPANDRVSATVAAVGDQE